MANQWKVEGSSRTFDTREDARQYKRENIGDDRGYYGRVYKVKEVVEEDFDDEYEYNKDEAPTVVVNGSDILSRVLEAVGVHIGEVIPLNMGDVQGVLPVVIDNPELERKVLDLLRRR